MRIHTPFTVRPNAALLSIIALFVLVAAAIPAGALQLTAEEQAFLQQKKRIVFISQTQYPPFEFVDDNGQHEGIMIDVARWMAVEMGFQPVFTADSFQKAQEAVLSGEVDVLTSLFFSQKRQERFLFTEPLFDVPASIFVRAERTDMHSVQDLNGKVIAIQRGDYAKEFLETNGIRFQVLDTDNFAQATDSVVAGYADAVIGDEQIVLYHIYQNRLNQDIKRIGEPLYIGKNCMSSRPENALLIRILNKGVAEARSSGVLDKINEKWFGKALVHPPSYIEKHRKEIAAGFVALLIGLIGVWFWNVQLRRTVRRQTKMILAREKALRESEENFRTFFETIDDLIFVGTADGRILYANPAVYQKLGFTPEETPTMHILDFHSKEKRSEAEAIFSAMCRGEGNVCPLPLQRKDGTLLPVETRIWFGKWNQTDCIYGICKDLRKEQEALQLFNRLFDHNPAVMAITRPSDGVFVSVNDAFVHTLGYSRKEVIGKTPSDLQLFVHPHEQQDAKRTLDRNDRLFDRELDVRCKDGRILHGVFYGERIDNQGEQFYLTVMIDQTARKQAEKTLLQEHAFRKTIIENIAEGLCVCQQTTEHPFVRFTVWNQNMVRITGYTLAEINQTGWYPLLASDESTAIEVEKRIQQAFQSQDLRNEQWPILRKDGEKRWLSISTSVVETDGGTVYVLGLVQDVTELRRKEAEQREMEQRLQQIEKAESLSRMAGAIAHHFNNQLMVILGNLDMASEACRQNEHARKNLEAMRKAVQKASEISHLMLIYLGQSYEQKEPVDLCDVCRRHFQEVAVRFPSHIRWDIQFPESGPKALLNVKQFHQALGHVITNAVEAIENRPGTIQCRLEQITGRDIPANHRYPVDRRPDPDASYSCIVVSDTGCGIDDDDLIRIMDPFFTSKFMGRGMGLALVLGIVRGHDGFLCVESEPGKGSSFRIVLPAIEAPIRRQPVSDSRKPAFVAEGVVLLVEDEVLVRDVTETMLQKLGFTVECASDGIEAVRLFEKEPDRFRLIISDVAMPLMDGWEMLSAIRRIRPGIPAILVSGYDEAHVLAGGSEELPQAVLEKPYLVQDLMDAVRKALHPTSEEA